MNWGQFLEFAGKLLTAVGVVFGSAWVLWNYIVGRTHKPRLQLRISAERVSRDGLEYLVVRTDLSNVGLARVRLVNVGCATTVYAHRLPRKTESVMEPRWETQAVFDLFADQRWVEPSGLLIDQQLMALPGLEARFVKVWAHVESKKVAWNATAVIPSISEQAVR